MLYTPYYAYSDQITLPAGGLASANTPAASMTAVIYTMSVPFRGVIRSVHAAHTNFGTTGSLNFGLWFFNALAAADAFCTGAILPTSVATEYAADLNNVTYKPIPVDLGIVAGPYFWTSQAAAEGNLNKNGITAGNLEVFYQCADGRPPTANKKHLYAVLACTASVTNPTLRLALNLQIAN